jgi:hypothetical protein
VADRDDRRWWDATTVSIPCPVATLTFAELYEDVAPPPPPRRMRLRRVREGVVEAAER